MKVEKKRMKVRKKNGFTVIELLVVISILGTLTLIGAPKFIGQTDNANEVKMKSDLKTYSSQVEAALISDPTYLESWKEIPAEEISEMRDSGYFMSLEGLLKEDEISKQDYYEIPSNVLSNSKYPETVEFIYSDSEGVLLYDKTKRGKIEESKNENTYPEKEKLEATPESMFEFVADFESYGYEVPGLGYGYFKYTGSNLETVVIPETIAGFELSSHYKMFSNLTRDNALEKIVFEGENVKASPAMFYGSNLNKIDLENYNSSNLETIDHMFSTASIGNLKLGDFGGKLKSISSVFSGFQTVSSDLSQFDLTGLTDLSYLFAGVKASSLNLSGIDVSQVTNMSNLFSNSEIESLNVSNWNTSNVQNMSSTFDEFETTSNLDLSHFNMKSVTNANKMFESSYFGNLVPPVINAENSISLENMFSEIEVETLKVVKTTATATDMKKMFYSTKIKDLDLSQLNTTNVQTMTSMFSLSNELEFIDLDNFDTSSVTDMGSMFMRAGSSVTKLLIDISSFEINDNTIVTKMFNNTNSSLIYVKNATVASKINNNTAGLSSPDKQARVK